MSALQLSYLLRNRLLAALPSKDQRRLLSSLELVSLQQAQILHKPGEPYHYVYFPIDAVVSFVSTMQNGAGVEVGLIGNEGMVGIAITMGTEKDLHAPIAIVQVPGESLRLKTEVFLREFKHCGALHDQVLLFFGFALRQVAQTAACNRMHLLINRLCRWLLMVQDRTGRDSFSFTHEFLAQMLGAPRAQVSLCAGYLQRSGWIRQGRGNIAILDRAKIEETACECYQILKEREVPPKRQVLGAHPQTGSDR